MKPIEDNLEDLLQTASAHGTVVDSGDFTISQAEALRKIREFGLEDSSYWVLTLVQAAVAGGASAINFSETGKLHHASVRGLADTVWVHLIPRLMTLDSVEDAASEALRRTFWALMKLGRFSILQGEVLLQWDGEQLHQHTTQGEPGVLHITVQAHGQDTWLAQNSWIVSHVRRARMTASHLDVLKRRANFCPIPIIFDGLPLAQGRAPLGNAKHSPIILGRGIVERGEQSVHQWLTPRNFDDSVTTGKPLVEGFSTEGSIILDFTYAFDLVRFREVEKDSGGKERSHEGFRYDPVDQSPAIIWYKNGVSVGSREYPKGPIGAQMVVNDSALSTDLTGLNFQADQDEVSALVGQLNRHWEQVGSKLSSGRGRLQGMQKSYATVEFSQHSLRERVSSRVGLGFAAGAFPAWILGGLNPGLAAGAFVLGFGLGQFLADSPTKAENGPFDALFSTIERSMWLVRFTADPSHLRRGSPVGTPPRPVGDM